MLLAIAVIIGLVAGSLRAVFRRSTLQIPSFTHSWLVLIAVIPQLLVFEIPVTGRWVPTALAKVILVGSQVLLLAFVWFNRRSHGVWLLGLGLGLNLLVIILNGGLMPITPEAASHVYPATLSQDWVIGNRLGSGKDVILPELETNLAILSDRFHLPDWVPYRVAFSLGDIFIAFGAFQILWNAGHVPRNDQVAIKTRLSS